MTDGYCVKCKTKRTMSGAHKVKTKNGRAAMKGNCSKCKTGMFKFGA